MSTQTSKLQLVKQANNENWSNDAHNANLQKIDDFATTIDPKKNNIASLASDSTILNLAAGVYQIALSAESSYIPERWGTLIIDRSNVTYGCVMFNSTTGKTYTRHMNGTANWHDSWQQLAPYIAGTWTPKLYDYETYKRDLTPQVYFKIGNFYVMFIYQSNVDYSGITTMVQYRNLPCTACIGGTIYLQGRKQSIAKDIGSFIQGSGTKAYARENIVSTDFANPSSSGITNAVLFGYD